MNVIVTKKRIKNFILRIDNKGVLKLSAPLYATKKQIDDFISQNRDWINKNYEKAIDKTLFYGPSCPSIYILGKELKVIIKEDELRFAEINENEVIIHKLSSDSIERAFIYLEKELDRFRLKVYSEATDKFLKLTNQRISGLRISKMSSARGRCYYQRREIVLAKSLIHKRIEFIEAVIMHEIAHLTYPNHSKDFYNYIDRFMPDYKERHSSQIID